MESFSDKQPYEEYYVDFDFVNVVVSPDTIASAVVSVVDELGADATATVTTAIKQNIDSPKVYIWVNGGTTGKVYTITCKVATVNGEKYEMEGTLSVTEK